MRLSINVFLIPGLCIWKIKGTVMRVIALDDPIPIPDIVDEIALCPSDYEGLAERIASRSGTR